MNTIIILLSVGWGGWGWGGNKRSNFFIVCDVLKVSLGVLKVKMQSNYDQIYLGVGGGGLWVLMVVVCHQYPNHKNTRYASFIIINTIILLAFNSGIPRQVGGGGRGVVTQSLIFPLVFVNPEFWMFICDVIVIICSKVQPFQGGGTYVCFLQFNSYFGCVPNLLVVMLKSFIMSNVRNGCKIIQAHFLSC